MLIIDFPQNPLVLQCGVHTSLVQSNTFICNIFLDKIICPDLHKINPRYIVSSKNLHAIIVHDLEMPMSNS